MTDTFEQLAWTRLANSAPYDEAERAAVARGFASGYAEGARRAEAELAARVAELEARAQAQQDAIQESAERQTALLDWVIDSLDMRLTPVLEAAQASLAAASLELATAMLGVDLADGERSARGIVERVLGAVDTAEVVTGIRVNPAEAETVRRLIAGRRELTVIPDAAISVGDAIAELPDAFLDARLQAAAERAGAALAAAREELG